MLRKNLARKLSDSYVNEKKLGISPIFISVKKFIKELQIKAKKWVKITDIKDIEREQSYYM